MNHSINDGHLGTSRATSKDIYTTWTPSAIKPDFETTRHHRSASGPDYVSSSRRHAEIPLSGRDYKPRNVSETQPLPIPSQMRNRESHYADAAHPRSSHRKDPTVDSTAYTSASKRQAHDPNVVRNNNSAEDVIQYPRVAKYERWIPPNQPTPASQPQEPHYRERERDREKDKQKTNYRDEIDAKEKHKRRYNEGDSDWDKDRERKERREKERYREWERERAKEQERERAKEDERVRAKERTKERDRHRDEREQERYAEKERRRAAEKEKEKGREKEKEREREREKEKDRERRRQKERESGQDRKRDRKDVEKQENTKVKADLDREKRKEREPTPLERDYRHEVERGRDSDRELLDRRKRKLDWESEREKEKVKEPSKRTGDVPVVTHRQEVEAQKAHETFRKDPVERGPMPLVVREQDMDRPRPSKKDTDSPRQRDLQKVNEQLEGDHAHHTDKENLPRREHKSYEKSKRSAGNRPHADRATDSERENPPQRDVGLSNPHLRETVLRGTVEAEPIATSRLPPLPPKQAKGERISYAFPMGLSTTTRVTAPAFFEAPRMTAANDGYGGHMLPTFRPVDQTLSVTPKYSPISVASAESQKMDMGTSENKVKSSQRALRRQSKMSSLVPDQIAVLSLSHAASKHNPSHVISSTRSDMVTQPPSSHAFRTEKEDVTHLHPTQVPVDSPLHNSPMPPAALAKTDNRTSTPMHKLTSSSLNNTGSRSLARYSTAMPLASLYDRPTVESSQATPSVPRDLQGGSSVPGIQPVTQRFVNDGDTKHASAFLSKPQVHTHDNSAYLSTSGHVAPLPVPRNPLDKTGKHTSLPSDRPISVAFNSVPASSSVPNGIVKTSSKGVVKAPNTSPLIVFEPEMKVTPERSQVVPQPGLMAVPLEMQQGSKRGGEPVVDRVQNASEVPVRRPPSVYGSSKDAVFLESLQEQKREKALVADSVHNTSEVPLRRPPSAAGWSTPQGSVKEAIHLEMQPEPKRERGPATDNVQNFPEAPLQRPPSVAGWSTLQSSTREAVHLETRQESKREKALMADRIQNTSNGSETSTRMFSSAAGGPTLPSIKEVAHLDPQQEPKREKLLVANRVQNPSEAPLVAAWPPLQGNTKEHSNPQQELKREKVLVANGVQNAAEAPLRIPSSAVVQGNNIREVVQLETQREPKKEKVLVANRVQNAPEVPSRRLPSAVAWPTVQGNFKESASLETQQEPKREKASVANKVQNGPEVLLRSAAGLPALQGSIREAAHLETPQEPKREKAPATDRVQNVTEPPLRIPSFTPGRLTLHGSAKELDPQQEPKKEKAVVDVVQNVPEVQLRIIPSATGPTLEDSVREAGPLETQQEPKRERLLVADRVQNADVPPRRPPSTAGWPALGSIKELASLESQREPKRERPPVAEAAPCETQQEPKRGREPVADRTQNSPEIPSRMPPPAAGSSYLQGNIREAAPLETQPEPKRERVSISDRTQNVLEVLPRRPPSVVGWSTSQGSTRDKATAYAPEPHSYPIEQPISTDGQPTVVNSAQMTSSTRSAGFYVSKQEGLLSRVQVKTPIPEDVSTSAPKGLPPSIHPETSLQTNTTVPDRHRPPEPSALPLTSLHSIGEPINTTTPVMKTLSKTPADVFVRNKQVTGESHPTSFASQENVPLLLPEQHGDRDGFNSRSREDKANVESFQSNSPATSLRRDAFVQPSLNKSSNVIEVPRNVPSRPPASNHSRNRSSTQKAAEELIVVASHSSSSKPSEETNIRATTIPLGRHVEQPGVGMPFSKDPVTSARTKGDRRSSVGQYTEQELMTPFRGAPADDGIIIAPTNHTVSVISRDSGHKSTRHPRQTDHRHSPQTPLHQVIDNASDTLQSQFREAITDKKPPPQVNNHFDAPSSREEKVYNHHNESQAPEDKKITIQHEGLARILDQPLDRHVKKTRASPSTQSSHSGLPQEEFQMSSNEVDRRQPVSGSPKTMLRSSSSMSHNAPSPIVKTLSHMNYGTNLKSNIIQENLVQDAYNRPNMPANGYPHHGYRSSSLYPTITSSTSHISSESSKNQMHPSHTLSIHNHANSYQSSSIEAGQSRNSPSHQTNPLTSHPPMPVKRPSADTTENGDPASSRHPSTHAKMSNSGSRMDVTFSQQSRPPDVPSNSRTLDIANGRTVFNEAVHLDTSSRTQESSPGVVPAVSLLLSKPTDPHGPSEHKGTVDMPISTSNHLARGKGNLHDSSPTIHELENHEPRLITPRIQKHPELTEEPRKKSHSLEVVKAKPLDEVHKKTASLDVVKSKSERPHEIWYPPNQDDQGEGKTRPQPISVAVANKGIPTALPADNGQSRSSTKPEHIRYGRKSPNIANMKVYRYLREKRNRTISAVSMEAQDGTAPNTVVGSPTASVISQAPPIHIPSPRDPMRAAQDWLTEGIQAAMLAEAQGRRRILRPGVVFDVGEDPPRDEQRHRSKRPRRRP